MEEFYKCKVIKDRKKCKYKVNFESFSYKIQDRKFLNHKKLIEYRCLLTKDELDRIRYNKDFRSYKVVQEGSKPVKADVYEIYCDGAVHGFGNSKKNVDLSALTTIIYKNGEEYFRTTNTYDQNLDSNTVEILALLIGLRHLEKNVFKRYLKQSKIIVSSDSQNLQRLIIDSRFSQYVISKCKSELKSDSSYYNILTGELLSELKYYTTVFDIYSELVKGHTIINISSNRKTLLNHICDNSCKQAIKKNLHKKSLVNSTI